MLLYKALKTEDEYQRLQLVSEGIKAITSEMPKIETIESTAPIKFLICCYPFQEQNIDMLISAFFDYYKNENFFWAYTQAISQIGEFQESKAAGYKKQSIFDVYQRKLKEGKTGLDHFYNFSDSAQQQMTKVKLYVCTHFSKYFSLAQDLRIDMSRIYDIYRIYLHNTNNKELIFELIESFENLKKTTFKNLPWIDTFQSEIDIYKQTLIPSRFNLKLKQNQQSLQQLYEQYKLQMENPSLQNQNSEENSPQVDQKAVHKQQIEQYQIALCKQNQVNLIDDSIDLYLFLKLIIKPQKYELTNDWNTKYGETTLDKDYQGFKINQSELEDLFIIRSYKALNSVLHCSKLEILKLKMQNLLPKIFHLIYKVLRDPEENVNLYYQDEITYNLNHNPYLLQQYHLGSLINKMLEMCPKHAIYQIIKLNLLFSFTQFFYNTSIVNVVLEILDFDTDKYQLGYFVQEQVWTYVNDTDWFQYLFTFLFKQNIDVSKKDENYQSERKTQVLSMLQSLNRNQRGSIKQQVTVNQSYFFQTFSTGDKLNELQSYDFLNSKDIDNLKHFNDDKQNFDPQKMEKMIEEHKQNQAAIEPKVPIEEQNVTQQRVSKYGRQIIEIPPKKKQVSLPKINTNSLKSPLKNVNSPLSRESSKNLSLDKDAQLSQKSKQSSSSLRRSDNQEDTLSQNKLIRIYQATSKTNASLFKQNQQSIQIKDIGLMESLQFIHRLLGSLQQFQKKFLSRKDCNLVEKTSKILTTENLVQIFQTFVSKIMKDDYGLICGQIVNTIFTMVLNEHLDVYYELLNEQFYNFIQEIGTLILLLEKQQNLGFKRHLVSSIYFNGFILNNQLRQNYLESNVYKYLSSKIFNQLQQYLVNYPENNNYQLQFTKFLNCVFSKAPAYLIQQILFNYGLLQVLFESQRVIILNDLQNVQSSLRYFAMQIIYLIKDILQKRSMQVILDNLQPLDLWQITCYSEFGQNTNYVKQLRIIKLGIWKVQQQLNLLKNQDNTKKNNIRDIVNLLFNIKIIYQKIKIQVQHQFKKQQTEQKLELSERSPTELCLTPDLTHRTLKNYRLRKPFDL